MQFLGVSSKIKATPKPDDAVTEESAEAQAKAEKLLKLQSFIDKVNSNKAKTQLELNAEKEFKRKPPVVKINKAGGKSPLQASKQQILR